MNSTLRDGPIDVRTMQIGTNYLQLNAMKALVGSIGTSASTPSALLDLTAQIATQIATGSLFGPDAMLSLGDSSSLDTGYSRLIAGTTGTSLIDLGSALDASRSQAAVAQGASQLTKSQSETLKQAQAYIDGGAYDKARVMVQDVLEENSQNGPAVHAMGVIELKQHRYKEAEQLFRRADQLAPDRGFGTDAENARILQKDDAAVLGQARRLLASDDTQEDGIRLLVNLTDRSPTNSEARMLLAQNLITSGDAKNGLQQYHMAVLTADEDQLGRIETRLSELVEIAPDAAYLRQLLGKTQLRLEKYDEAGRTLAVATSLANGDPTYKADEALAIVGQGRERLAQGDVTGAISKFELAREYAPTGTEVKKALGEGYAERAEAKYRAGASEAAVMDYRLAASNLGKEGTEQLREGIARGAFTAGLAVERDRLAAGEDIDKEVLAFQVAYDLDSTNTTYKRKLASTRSALGDQYLADSEYADAAAAYNKAYDLYKNNTTYRNAAVNAYKLAGDEYMTQTEYDKAIAAYDKAFDLNSYDATTKSKLADAYNTRGLYYKDLGKLTPAKADFHDALNLFPTNTTYRTNYDSV